MKHFTSFSSLLVLGTVGLFFSSLLNIDDSNMEHAEEDIYLYL